MMHPNDLDQLMRCLQNLRVISLYYGGGRSPARTSLQGPNSRYQRKQQGYNPKFGVSVTHQMIKTHILQAFLIKIP